MKIYAYEVRDDEIDYFTQAQKKFDAWKAETIKSHDWLKGEKDA